MKIKDKLWNTWNQLGRPSRDPFWFKIGGKSNQLDLKYKEFLKMYKDFKKDYTPEEEHPLIEYSLKPKVLYFDIETTDLSAGFGIMLMFACRWHDETDTKLFKITDYDYRQYSPEMCDVKVVEELGYLINTADILVAHYGSKFDIPFLQTRLIMHGIHIANSKWKKILDPCITSRKKFKFGSNRLKVISRAMSSDHEKTELPLNVWKHSKCIGYEPYFSEALEAMSEYCINDVDTLYDIAQPMWPMVKHLPSFQAITGINGFYCPSPVCGSREIIHVGVDPCKVNAYNEYKCLKCGNIFRGTKSIRSTIQEERVMY